MKHENKLNTLFITLIIILSLIPIMWFRFNHIIATGDIFPFIVTSENYQENFYLWGNENVGFTSQNPTYLVYKSIWYVFSLFGLSANLIQILIYILQFMGAGLSVYFLAFTIYKKEKVGSFIAATFYMFNFFIMLGNLNYGIRWAYTFLPLLLATFVRIVDNIKNNQSYLRNIIYFCIISTILFSVTSINIAVLVVTMLSVVLIFFYYLIFEKNVRKNLLKIGVILFFLILLISIWWISPILNQYTTYSSNSFSVGTTTEVTQWSWTHVRSSFLNLFWLNGTWNWRPEYFTYLSKYSNPLLIILVFIPILLAFFSLFLKKDKFNYFLGICILGLFFLSKGLHPPFESINLFLYKNIPFFFIFRTAFGKFELIIVIFLALLIGSGVNDTIFRINKSKTKYKKQIVYSLVVVLPLIFIISTFPLFTGEVIKGPTKDLPFSAHVKIPAYWYDASIWFNSLDNDSGILLTPNDDFYQMPYKWGYYGVDLFAPILIQKPTLQQQYGYLVNPNYNKLMTQIYESIENDQEDGFLNLVRVLNVKYILQRNDIWWDFGKRKIISPEKMNNFLTNQTGIKFDKKFGELDIYKLEDDKFLEHIYGTDKFVIAKDFEAFVKQLEQENFSSKDTAIFVANQFNKSKIDKLISMDIFKEYNSISNDFKDPSFEQGFWQSKAGDCCNKNPNASKVFASLSEDAYEGKFSVNLTSYSQCACVAQKIPNFDNSQTYLLEFNYKGDNPGYCIWVEGDGECIPRKFFGKNDWSKETNSLYFTNKSKSASLFFYANFQGGPVTNLYDNVKLSKLIFQTNITAYKPNLEFTKISPVRYDVQIKNASQSFFLVFSESYDPRWKAYITSPDDSINWFNALYKNSIDEDSHFITNYYANSWYIDKVGTYNIALYYKPQSYFYLGIIISGTALALCIIYLVYDYRKNRSKNA